MAVEVECKTWKAAPGARFGNKKAQVYGECIEALCERSDAPVSPYTIVAEARKKRSPLHAAFEWDDTVAANKYRVVQARHLIKHIVVVVEDDNGEKEEMPAFYNVVQADDGTRGYTSILTVQAEPDYQRQVIAAAIKQLAIWQKRYGQYNKLASAMIRRAIDELKK